MSRSILGTLRASTTSTDRTPTGVSTSAGGGEDDPGDMLRWGQGDDSQLVAACGRACSGRAAASPGCVTLHRQPAFKGGAFHTPGQHVTPRAGQAPSPLRPARSPSLQIAAPCLAKHGLLPSPTHPSLGSCTPTLGLWVDLQEVVLGGDVGAQHLVLQRPAGEEGGGTHAGIASRGVGPASSPLAGRNASVRCCEATAGMAVKTAAGTTFTEGRAK